MDGPGELVAPSAFRVDASAEANTLLPSHHFQAWLWLFLAIGIVARCVRYFSRFPLWEDEAFVCASLIDLDYAGLMAPLDYQQVAPLLYLWAQLSLVKLLGFQELTLRLISFVSSIGSLLLFYRLARRSLPELAQLIAVGLFAVTYGCIRYAAEAKPYGSDLFVALVFYNLASNWLESGRSLWLWLMALLIPVAIGFSYPATFVGSGLVIAIFFCIWRDKRWGQMIPLTAFGFAFLIGFALFYFLNIRSQSAQSLDTMHECWGDYFPPLTNPLALLHWLFKVHSEDMIAYPFGSGAAYGAVLTFPLWIAGLAWLIARREGKFLIFCLAPLAMNLAAAALHRYPYGGAFKFVIYAGPLVCMVLGYGLAESAAWIRRQGYSPGIALSFSLACLVIVGTVAIGRDLAWPFKSRGDQWSRSFAVWFWPSMEQKGEVACINSDLGKNFTHQLRHQLNGSAGYFCNRRVYSPRQNAALPVAWDKISRNHPLYCLHYRSPAMEFDEAACRAWLEEMQETFTLVSRESFPMMLTNKSGNQIRSMDYVEVFKFVPRFEPSTQPPRKVTAVPVNRTTGDSSAP